MIKQKLIEQLNIEFARLNKWLQNHPDDKFEEITREGKWSAGQHVKHLLMGISPVNKAMTLPKFFLKYKFGICNRNERTYEELVVKYKTKLANNTSAAPIRFSPDIITNSEKKDLIKKLEAQKIKMIKHIGKWSEKDLSTYILPHPLLGKLTFREMIYFTSLHTDHHRKILEEFHSQVNRNKTEIDASE